MLGNLLAMLRLDYRQQPRHIIDTHLRVAERRVLERRKNITIGAVDVALSVKNHGQVENRLVFLHRAHNIADRRERKIAHTLLRLSLRPVNLRQKRTGNSEIIAVAAQRRNQVDKNHLSHRLLAVGHRLLRLIKPTRVGADGQRLNPFFSKRHSIGVIAVVEKPALRRAIERERVDAIATFVELRQQRVGNLHVRNRLEVTVGLRIIARDNLRAHFFHSHEQRVGRRRRQLGSLVIIENRGVCLEKRILLTQFHVGGKRRTRGNRPFFFVDARILPALKHFFKANVAV